MSFNLIYFSFLYLEEGRVRDYVCGGNSFFFLVSVIADAEDT